MNEPNVLRRERCDVCIIGAGWSGLLAARHMLEAGLSVLVLESRSELGGVWRFSADPEVVSVMSTTITSSSAAVTEASDFPMDPALGNFVHHRDILRYLERYATHHGLLEHIRFGRRVRAVRRHGARWRIRDERGVVSARFVVVCTGPNQRPRATIPALARYEGELVHAGRIKSITPQRYGRRDHVLVYGGGESASDIVELLVTTEASITWSIPRGQHFFRKAAYPDRAAVGCYGQHDSALDEASSRCVQLVAPFHRAKPGMRWLCLLGSTGSLLDYEGHGLLAWRKGVPFMRAFVNKNGHVVEHVKAGRVDARGPITRVAGRRVTFACGRAGSFSHVILCTGYEPAFPYLPPAQAQRGAEERYKLIFDPDDPTLAFIGFARPNVGSIPMMSEVQSMYAARVFAGRVTVPDRGARLTEIAADRARRDAFFHHQRRAPGLVHCFDYGYEIARLAGVAPRYGALLLRHPLLWLKTFFAPANSAQFRLADRRTRRRAAAQMWRRQRLRYFVYPLVYLAARLLWIDRAVEALQAAHRWLQRRRGDNPARTPARTRLETRPNRAEPAPRSRAVK